MQSITKAKIADNAVTKAKIRTLTKKESLKIKDEIFFCNNVILPAIRLGGGINKMDKKENKKEGWIMKMFAALIAMDVFITIIALQLIIWFGAIVIIKLAFLL